MREILAIQFMLRFFSVAGASRILEMPNFSPRELTEVFAKSEEFFKSHGSASRGKNLTVLIFYVVFITLVVFKVDGSWECLPSLFKFTSSTFQRLIGKVMDTFNTWAVKCLVKDHELNLIWPE